MCKFLVNRGCKFDHQDKGKKTAQFYARLSKHSEIVEYLNSLKGTNKPKTAKV